MKKAFISTVIFSLMLFPARAEEKAAASEGENKETVTVASIQELETAAAKATPGTTIVLKNGEYKTTCALKGKGTKEAPIVIRAETVDGVVVKHKTEISGDYLSVIGFRLNSVHVSSGTGCRISRCHTQGSNEAVAVEKSARNVEIDHCLFEKKPAQKGVLCRIESTGTGESHHIHHNHFRDAARGEFSNGGETLQIYNRDNRGHASVKGTTGNVVEYNLFERCDGDPEVISVKSSGNLFRGNTFRNGRGQLVLRQGDRNVINGNWFFEQGGVRITGQDQVIINNYFSDLEAGLSTMDGTKDHFYRRVERALIAHNTFVDCDKAFSIGQNHSKYPDGFVAAHCTIANNLMYQSKDAESGLIFFNKDQEPEKWTWRNNQYHGELGISEREGLKESSVFQLTEEPKLLLPTDATPTAGRADLTWPEGHDKDKAGKGVEELNVDLAGTTRPEMAMIGAFQFTGKPIVARPLTEKDVGPMADRKNGISK